MASETPETNIMLKTAKAAIFLVMMAYLLVFISCELANDYRTTPEMYLNAIIGVGATTLGAIEISKRI